MADENDAPNAVIDWLTIPDIAERLGETPGRVRRLLDERHLVASRREGRVVIPAAFVPDGRVLSSLRGTVIVLSDAGFSDDEIIAWLFDEEPSLGHPPIESLLAGRKAEVRRVAQTLA